MWGYKNYETTDDSRNNWWVALITYGEGWHNNHHAHQRSAAHGHRWWELDVSYLTIRAMELVGLASDVVKPRGHSLPVPRATIPMPQASAQVPRTSAAPSKRMAA